MKMFYLLLTIVILLWLSTASSNGDTVTMTKYEFREFVVCSYKLGYMQGRDDYKNEKNCLLERVENYENKYVNDLLNQ